MPHPELPVAELLHPRRFPNMSTQMAAIVGCILDSPCTEPAIAELIVTADGAVLARPAGGVAASVFLGSYVDLEANWRRLLIAADLTPEQREQAEAAFERHLTRY